MKVVHLGFGVVPIPPGDIAAGREEYVYQLTDHLGRLGCQVDVIDIKGGVPQKEKRQKSPAKFHELWHPPLPRNYNFPFLRSFFTYLLQTSLSVFFALSCSLALFRLLRKEKIDIIHVYDANVAIAGIIANKLTYSTAVTIYTPQTADLMVKFPWYRHITAFAEILALKRADHIIALTPMFKERLVAEFNIKPEKISQIYVGTATDEIEQFLSRKAGTFHQSNNILCVGVICERKNQLTALKAMKHVTASHPEVRLVFAGPVGEAGYLNSMQRFISENELSQQAEVKGEVSKQELYNLYSDAKILVFPTTAEVQPTVLMEALAFGLPVIASTIKAIADVISQKEGSGIMVDPYDADGLAAAVIRVLEDSALRQSMSNKAKELAKTVSYENIAGQTIDLYNELVQDKSQD